MNQMITVSPKTIETILDRLDKLTKEVREIKAKLIKEPPYGSSAWWLLSEKRADEDVAAGRVVSFNSVKEAVKWLNS